MPTSVVKKYAKKKGISVKKSEKRWEKAKKIAKEEGKDKVWPYVMGIYKRMMGMNESHMFSFDEFIGDMVNEELFIVPVNFFDDKVKPRKKKIEDRLLEIEEEKNELEEELKEIEKEIEERKKITPKMLLIQKLYVYLYNLNLIKI